MEEPKEDTNDEQQVDPNVCLFPKTNWTSEGYKKDSWHLKKLGLDKWLQTVRAWAQHLAHMHEAQKILVVTDSTFSAHYYQARCRRPSEELKVTISTPDGEHHSVSISPAATIRY